MIIELTARLWMYLESIPIAGLLMLRPAGKPVPQGLVDRFLGSLLLAAVVGCGGPIGDGGGNEDDGSPSALPLDEVRFWGEPVAIVAADDQETARRAAEAVVVDYEPLNPLTDPEEAERRGEAFRTMRVVNGDQDRRGEVAVEGYYETGTIDQATLRGALNRAWDLNLTVISVIPIEARDERKPVGGGQ